MAETRNVGLRALIRAAGLEGKPLTAGRIGFVLAPRLNAVGRLGHALRGVELLLTDDESEANRIARELEEMNRKRQDIDRTTLARARQLVERLDLEDTYGIVLADAQWHPGVVGIVASRLVEEFARPVLLIAVHDGIGKGSGRSIPVFDLHAGLGECRDLLLRFGGHKAAAGITIESSRVADFAQRFNEVARARLTPEDLVPVIRVDLEVPLEGASEELETLLRHFEPFGVGNPAPVLMVRGARLAGTPRVVGEEGLRLRLAGSEGEIDALGWGMASLATTLASGQTVDATFRLERDEWNGRSRLQARLSALRWQDADR
jgi:single-stranded-DNA-specific exonuclease